MLWYSSFRPLIGVIISKQDKGPDLKIGADHVSVPLSGLLFLNTILENIWMNGVNKVSVPLSGLLFLNPYFDGMLGQPKELFPSPYRGYYF